MPAAQDANIPPAPEGRRRLPIGIQTFRELREGGYYYVDKTGLLGRLVDGGKHYFLSRPRRFGKSLLVDTLKELFEGNRPLFEGLAIHDRWDWTASHPVVRLDFGAGDFGNPEHLPKAVLAQLDAAGEDAGVATRYEGYYASVFYACLAALGLDVRVEDSTNRGRLDLAVLLDARVYLFEFKVAERASEGSALAELLDRRYADKYRDTNASIHLIGVEFSQATRDLTAFDVAAG